MFFFSFFLILFFRTTPKSNKEAHMLYHGCINSQDRQDFYGSDAWVQCPQSGQIPVSSRARQHPPSVLQGLAKRKTSQEQRLFEMWLAVRVRHEGTRVRGGGERHPPPLFLDRGHCISSQKGFCIHWEKGQIWGEIAFFCEWFGGFTSKL